MSSCSTTHLLVTYSITGEVDRRARIPGNTSNPAEANTIVNGFMPSTGTVISGNCNDVMLTILFHPPSTSVACYLSLGLSYKVSSVLVLSLVILRLQHMLL